MPLDPATLCARTAAGDAELAAPRHGLAIAQRRLLSLMLTASAGATAGLPERFARRRKRRPDTWSVSFFASKHKKLRQILLVGIIRPWP